MVNRQVKIRKRCPHCKSERFIKYTVEEIEIVEETGVLKDYGFVKRKVEYSCANCKRRVKEDKLI